MPIATLAIEHRDFGVRRHLTWLKATAAVDTRRYDGLIAAFLELHKNDLGLAVRTVNAACGTFYARLDIGKWGRMERRAPEHAREFMRTEVLRARFGREAADALCRLLNIDATRSKKLSSGDDESV